MIVMMRGDDSDDEGGDGDDFIEICDDKNTDNKNGDDYDRNMLM